MTAPAWNSVDVFKGEAEKRPSKFMAALSEADNLVAELDTLREMQTRNEELEAEIVAICEAFEAAVGFYDCPCGAEYEFAEDSSLEEYAGLNRWLGAHVPCGAVAGAERDDLADRIVSLNNAHQITLVALATANAQLKRMAATR